MIESYVNKEIFNSNNKKLSPVIKQYLSIKENNEDCIIFYRLGDFYELFLDDAIVGSRILDLTLTGKDCGVGERAPMCGIPFHAYESYAQRLIERGYKVAICEQTDEIRNGLVQREIVRIITPGTVVESSMLNERKNSYIMCIYAEKSTISYAYSDLSTGEIKVAEYSGANIAEYINDQIVRIMPSEIICNKLMMTLSKDLVCSLRDGYRFSEYFDWAFNYADAEKQILTQYNLKSLAGFDIDSKPSVKAIGALLAYFQETQKRDLKHLNFPKKIFDQEFMYLDTNTRRNLEIEQTKDGERKGTLLWVLDNTCTNIGSRMLRNWVRQPLQNKQEIDKRLNMVESLVNDTILRANLKITLQQVQDIERIVGKVGYGSFSPKDCVALKTSLYQVPMIKKVILSNNNQDLLNLANQLVDVHEIADMINATIVDEPPLLFKNGNYIKPGFNANLDHIKSIRDEAENYISQMEAQERETTGIKTLRIGHNRVFGYYIEVGKQYVDQVPFRYVRKQTTANGERYITEELKQFEEQVFSSHETALNMEEAIFAQVKEQILANASVLQQIARVIAQIDCIYSLATVAITNDYHRPNITNGKDIDIVAGRHPVVEKMQRDTDFIANDCKLNESDQRTMILTGPNMAGKSTYMRQVALITYMAHIGSFVPARKADICIVDRIFTRIGASDDLSIGQSTFMVEMIEVANILHYATNNSLIILDEVGRGTSTFDGLSIAWAVVEYLSKHLNAKTLFATHYHELMQLEGLYDGVKNFCISIKEIGGQLVFMRKIMRGSATKSYGIEVASLAGLPKEIINRAKELIKEFESTKVTNEAQKESEIVDTLKSIDPNSLTPLVAFDTLVRLIELAK